MESLHKAHSCLAKGIIQKSFIEILRITEYKHRDYYFVFLVIFTSFVMLQQQKDVALHCEAQHSCKVGDSLLNWLQCQVICCLIICDECSNCDFYTSILIRHMFLLRTYGHEKFLLNTVNDQSNGQCYYYSYSPQIITLMVSLLLN